MKQNAQGIVIQCYGLVVTDEMLSQHRASLGASSRMSDERLRAKILKGLMAALLINYALRVLEDRITGLIGTADKKDSRFIYSRGTVSHVFHVAHIC